MFVFVRPPYPSELKNGIFTDKMMYLGYALK